MPAICFCWCARHTVQERVRTCAPRPQPRLGPFQIAGAVGADCIRVVRFALAGGIPERGLADQS